MSCQVIRNLGRRGHGSSQFYQDMIDRGWRRSGDYIYQSDAFFSLDQS